MAKLTSIEKELARNFKKEIAEMGGKIFYNRTSGMSAVIMPNDRMKGFVRVYVAYCSLNDFFSKKRARLVLQDRVYNDNYILIPVSNDSYSDIAENIIFQLRE